MIAAVTALNQQIKMLAPELNSADIPNLVIGQQLESPTRRSTDGQGARARRCTSSRPISRPGTADRGIPQVAGMTGDGNADRRGREPHRRSISAGAFADAFAANDVHIYEIDLTAATCP